MGCKLTKINGRTIVTTYRMETIEVWVPDQPVIPVPPPAPPIFGDNLPPGMIPITPSLFEVHDCMDGGVPGLILVYLNSDGTIVVTPCLTGSFGVQT